MLAYENYSVEWYIPRIQTAPLALSSSDDYKFLLDHALKRREDPTANIVIQTLLTTKKRKHGKDRKGSGDENESSDDQSENSSSEDEKPKKKQKKDKKGKPVVELALNEKTTSKIVQLQNQWSCSKAGCSGNHCFIHPEHPDHFLIGHEQLLVWASAWNKDSSLANLETPPNHPKFSFIPGRKSDVSPLLQRRLAERNQPATGHASPVINFNIPPDLFAPLHPQATSHSEVHTTQSFPQAPITSHDPNALISAGAKLGPDLSLDEFCVQYSLSNDIQKKLHENGYTGTETLTFIIVAELKEMGFKFGEVVAIKAAMQH